MAYYSNTPGDIVTAANGYKSRVVEFFDCTTKHARPVGAGTPTADHDFSFHVNANGLYFVPA